MYILHGFTRLVGLVKINWIDYLKLIVIFLGTIGILELVGFIPHKVCAKSKIRKKQELSFVQLEDLTLRNAVT